MQTNTRWPWIMLPARSVLFLAFQLLFGVGFLIAGSTSWLDQSAAWWPIAVTLTNLVCLFALIRLYRQEGSRFWDLFRIERAQLKRDLLPLLGILVLTLLAAFLPNILLASALFGDQTTALRLLMPPLPGWAVAASMLCFPVTQGLVELPAYFLYVMPRLGRLVKNPWLAYALASFFLGFQHIFIPLRLDLRFIAWRGLMFLPFACLMGLVLKWRPRWLPYLASLHALLDFATAAMLGGAQA